MRKRDNVDKMCVSTRLPCFTMELLTLLFSFSVLQIIVFLVALLLTILLSVLRFSVSDCLFKLFFRKSFKSKLQLHRSQCIGTDMAYRIYKYFLLFRFTMFLNRIIIVETMTLFPHPYPYPIQAIPFKTFGNLNPKSIKLCGYLIF